MVRRRSVDCSLDALWPDINVNTPSIPALSRSHKNLRYVTPGYMMEHDGTAYHLHPRNWNFAQGFGIKLTLREDSVGACGYTHCAVDQSAMFYSCIWSSGLCLGGGPDITRNRISYLHLGDILICT